MLRRRSPLFWAATAVALAALLVYGPAAFARSATGPGEPVNFLSRPLDGWSFVLAVAGTGGAKAGSPSQAAAIAAHGFAGTAVQPVSVGLLWLPDRRVTLGSGKGSRTVTTNSKLVWRVSGRLRPGGPVQTVGLIDYSSGALSYYLFSGT